MKKELTLILLLLCSLLVTAQEKQPLQQASYKLAEVAYSNQDAAAAGAGAAGAAPQQDDGPIEADYEVVDDKNEGK